MPEALALRGGERTVPEGFIKPWPHVTEADRKAVLEVLDTPASSGAPGQTNQQRLQSEGLAREWAEYMGVKHCIPVNSGTAALHMCVAGLGIEPGDEVILPAFTFWASAAAVLHHNAIPVFVDVDPRTYCLDPGLIEGAVTEHTKAIMPVHIHGMPADMDAVLEIARKHGLGVIEDVAQAHGARYKGRLCGSMGDAAGYSTQASKTLSSGCQGGLFTTDDDEVHHRAALVQYFGERVVPGCEREEQEYNARGLGWMYRGDMFAQAFVRSQLRRLDEMNALRVRNCDFLTKHLKDIPGIETPVVADGCEPVYYNYVVGFDPKALGLDVPARELRDKAVEALRAEGVPAGLWQRRTVPAQDVFQKPVGYGKGCPWRCHGRKVDYSPANYPRANAFLESHCYVYDVNPPNDLELMGLYVKAFGKVMAGLDQMLDD
jgi:dTDP-4-amino-4,6-dideoxygalactose transaminase